MIPNDALENVKQKLLTLADKGRLTCAEAHQLAEAAGLPLSTIGKLAEDVGVKITDCQLGCFGKHKER